VQDGQRDDRQGVGQQAGMRFAVRQIRDRL